MKSKGFTLIELLAVIVILAVIALIATPLIMGTITKAKKNAFIDTANGIIKAGENYQAEQVMTTTGDVEDLVISDLTTDTKLQYKGSKPKSGTLKITSDGKTAIAIWSGQLCAVKNYDDKKVTVDDSIKTKEECVIPVETTDTSCFETNEIELLSADDITINVEQCRNSFNDYDEPSVVEAICQNKGHSGETLKQEILESYYEDDLTVLQEYVSHDVVQIRSNREKVLEITKYHFENDACPTDVVIPETIDGKTVESIGKKSFDNCPINDEWCGESKMTSIQFPSSIHVIKRDAFNGYYFKEQVNLSHLTNIFWLDYAFDYAFEEKGVYLPNQYLDYSPSFSQFFNCGENDTLKIKKGSVPVVDIIERQNQIDKWTLEIIKKIDETNEYEVYQVDVGCDS